MNWLLLLAESFLIIVGMITFLGNLFTILAFALKPNLRMNPSYWYLASLAIADGCVGLLAFPATLYDEFHRHPSDKRLCNLIAYCTFVTVIPTYAHLTIISVDRYFKLVTPLKYIKHMNVTRAKGALLIIWIISLLGAALFVLSDHTFQDSSCLALKIGDGSEHHTSAFIFWTFIVFFQHLPVCLLIFLNCHIYRIASSVRRVAQRELTINNATQRVELRIHRGKVTFENAVSTSSATSSRATDFSAHQCKPIFSTSSSALNACLPIATARITEQTVSAPSSPSAHDFRQSNEIQDKLFACTSHITIEQTHLNDSLVIARNHRKRFAVHNLRVRKIRDWVTFGVKQRKIAILISVIVIAAALCWIPASTIYMIKWYCAECTWSRETWISFLNPWPIYFNSTMNPFILLFMSEDFRKAYHQLYSFIVGCGRRKNLPV